VTIPASQPAWFHDNGVGVFPIKPGTKEPAVKWRDYHCSRDAASRFGTYGVPLTGLLVVDADSPESAAWIAANIPPTPFTVTTGPYHDGQPGRGQHHYFRAAGPLPKFIHRDGLTIESRNDNQYVIGPGSRHPSGVIYTASEWSWQWNDIPIFPSDFRFDDRPPSPGGPASGEFEFPNEAKAGERHHLLFKQIRSWRHVFTLAEAREAIHHMNQEYCRPPLTEDADFDAWFKRVWNTPDRPFPTAPLRGLRGLSWR
jgi:hypothetical protein